MTKDQLARRKATDAAEAMGHTLRKFYLIAPETWESRCTHCQEIVRASINPLRVICPEWRCE